MKTLNTDPPKSENGATNALLPEDRAVHGWYRFVLSYPPHLVRRYGDAFGLGAKDLLFDPFCGTGTTLVEAKKHGIPSVGCDAHPFAALVSRVKTNWSLDVPCLRRRLKRIVTRAAKAMRDHELEALSFDAELFCGDSAATNGGGVLTEAEQQLLPTGFLSARPLQRLLLLRGEIDLATKPDEAAYREFFYVTFAHVIANGAGNFAFGPEIYRTKPKPDYDVLGHFARHCTAMIEEMDTAQKEGIRDTPARVIQADARSLEGVADQVSAVITSPPYPNEKDYTRTTRVEAVLLRLVSDRPGLREAKEALLRSNTRNVFVDDRDGDEVAGFCSIRKVCDQIERRRVELGKTSGFERLYHKVVAHYFGGMRRHFRALWPRLRSRARLAYVVGDQLSFLMVPVPTAQLLGEVAVAEGFRIAGCELWRERIGTKVRNDARGRKTIRVREEVLVLERR